MRNITPYPLPLATECLKLLSYSVWQTSDIWSEMQFAKPQLGGFVMDV